MIKLNGLGHVRGCGCRTCAGCSVPFPSGLNGLGLDLPKRDKKGEAVSIGTAIGTGAVTGASVGAVAGPWGALIGGVVGAAAGGTAGYFGKESVRKKFRKQQKQAFVQLVAEDTARREAAAKARGALVDATVERARLENLKATNRTRALLLAKRADVYGADDLRDEALDIAGSDPFLDEDMVEEGMRLDQSRLVEIEGEIAQYAKAVAALRPSAPVAGSPTALKKQVVDKAEALLSRMVSYQNVGDLQDQVNDVLSEDVYTEQDDAAALLTDQIGRLDGIMAALQTRVVRGMAGLGDMSPALGQWFADTRQENRQRVGLPAGRVRPQGYLGAVDPTTSIEQGAGVLAAGLILWFVLR